MVSTDVKKLLSDPVHVSNIKYMYNVKRWVCFVYKINILHMYIDRQCFSFPDNFKRYFYGKTDIEVQLFSARACDVFSCQFLHFIIIMHCNFYEKHQPTSDKPRITAVARSPHT